MLNEEYSTVSTPRGSTSKQSVSDRIDILLSEYKFRIEAIFDYSPARDTFRKYLKKVCLNEEPFMFYEQVENYQKTRLDKNRLELAADIINQFIVVNSKHELNMSMAIRNEILKQHAQILIQNQNLSNLELLTCPSDLFAKAQDLIFIELKQDNFPRFVKSTQFRKFMIKEFKKNEIIFEMLGERKGDDDAMSIDPHSMYLKEHSHEITADLPLIDTSSFYVTPKDYELVKEIISTLSDPLKWNVVSEKSGSRTMVSTKAFYFNEKEGAYPLTCTTGMYTGHHKQFFHVIFSPAFEKNMRRIFKTRFQLEHLKIDASKGIEFPNTVFWGELNAPIIMKKRELVVARTIIPDQYDPETGQFNRYVMLQKPTNHPECPKKDSTIRCSLYTAIIAEKKTDDTMRYYIFDTVDFKGSVPKFVINKASKLFAAGINKMFKSMIKHKIDENQLLSCNGTLEIMKEHENYLRELIKKKAEQNQADSNESNVEQPKGNAELSTSSLKQAVEEIEEETKQENSKELDQNLSNEELEQNIPENIVE